MIDLVIKAQRPELSDSSLKVYLSALKKLNNNEPIKNIEYLKDFDSIVSKMESKSDNTKKGYLNAVIVTLLALNQPKELIKKYEELRDRYQNEYSDMVASHEKTEKQKANWVEWSEWIEMAENLKEKAKHLKKKIEWTSEDQLIFQDHVITTLYKHYPVRNDFHDMKVITKREYNKLSDSEKKQSNFIVLGNPMLLILNEYKTKKKYGEKKIKVEPEVANVIREYLKHNNSGYLLTQPHNFVNPMTSNGVTWTLQRISAREFDGKKIGSSLLRHMFLSEKYRHNVQDKAKDSYIMGHSLGMQNDYIKV